MRRLTGIELGPDSCVLVRVRPDGDAMQVSAVHGLQPAESPDPRMPLGEYLREVRRRKHFPRRARVVAWRLHQSASSTDAATLAALRPLRQAGFAVDTVLKPAEALAVLARTRSAAPGREGAAWVSINRHGAAIAIVHRGDLLYSRELDWHYRQAATAREELLQRYSLVAHLAPELRHGIGVVRAVHGIAVDAIVTCGDLPDLRSLTMPMIEELDVEVETLDSLEGLQVVAPAASDGAADNAPALRLACAAAAGRSSPRRRGEFVSRGWQAAAAVVLLAAATAWGAFKFLSNRDSPSAMVIAQPVPSSAASAADTAPPAAASPAPASPSTQAPQSGEPGDPARPAATMGREEALPRRVVKPLPAPARSAEPDHEAVRPRQRGPVPLNEPLPAVNSILVSPDRRLAVVDGAIVHEGDAIGRRVLVRIEPGAVVLREPSGHEVRVFILRRVGAGDGGGSGL